MACRGLTAVILIALCLTWTEVSKSEQDQTYIAAVYEHQVILNPDPKVAVGRRAALEHMNKNLHVFEEQAALAAGQGAQIIVFPEDGIHGFNYSRSSIAGYLETVPDPEAVKWSPCAEPDRFPKTEVLHRLSCIAHKNDLYVVANMPDSQPCDISVDPLCPSDGQYQFNTNVVFSDNGTIVARYHKQNLFFEDAFDTPPKCEYVTFTTPFAGRFGVFTCFDILFREPVVTLVKDMGIRQLVFPTAWMNSLPLLSAVQFQRSFSYSANVTLLAANLRAEAFKMTGSGIYTPWDAFYYHAKEEEAGKLMVHRIPVLDPSMLDASDRHTVKAFPFSRYSGEEHEKSWSLNASQREFDTEYCIKEDTRCTEELLTDPPTPFTSTMMYDNFTLVPLIGRQGNLTVCDGSFCCHLLFQRSNHTEDEVYALGAFKGLHVVEGTYYLEICALIRCTSLHKSSCGGETEYAQTQVDFHLQGTFSTEYVYIGVLGSGMTLDRPDQAGRDSGGRVYMSRRGMPTGLVTAVLYGRVYDKDRLQAEQLKSNNFLFPLIFCCLICILMVMMFIGYKIISRKIALYKSTDRVQMEEGPL